MEASSTSVPQPFRVRPYKTLRRYEEHRQPRFLTFSCHQRLQLLGTTVLREAFAEQLEVVHRRGAFQLIAWVVMPEHVHLLLTPSLPDWPVPRILTAIKRPFAERLIRRWRQRDAPILQRLFVAGQCYRFWMRGGGYDRNIDSEPAVCAAIDYMHANPERKGLVRTAEQWRWSSARWYEDDRSGPVTLDTLDFL